MIKNSLNKYHEKRDFKETKEPKGEITKTHEKFPIFVVQKHDATRLHYDFRLELHGVLLSWAVPKGPSMNSADKRLALMVEDHPFDYKDFEGIIPKGNYGAGTVMVWDEGVYLAVGATTRKESDKLVSAGLHKGHIDIILNGEKLKGQFAIIRTPSVDKDQKNSWLLIKKNDEYSTKKDITKLDKSIKTGRDLKEIAQDG